MFAFQFPAWSPDGRWIAFDAQGPNAANHYISVVHPDGTGFRFLTLVTANNWAPAWR